MNPFAKIWFGQQLMRIFPLCFLMLALIVTVTQSSAEMSSYTQFFGDKDKCHALATVGNYGYEIVAAAHAELLTYGNNDEKFDAFFVMSIKKIKDHLLVKKYSTLFDDSTVEQILKDGIYIWERSGEGELKNVAATYLRRVNLCMNPNRIESDAANSDK